MDNTWNKFKEDVYNRLYYKGLSNRIEVNKSILGLGVIILLDKDNILSSCVNKRLDVSFINTVINMENMSKEELEILEMSCRLISTAIDCKELSYLLENMLSFKEGLQKNLLNLSVFEDSMFKDYSLTCMKWINNLVLEIGNKHNCKNILNIDCGSGDFLVAALCNEKERVEGRTINKEFYEICKIKSFLSNGKFEVFHSKTLFEPYDKNERYDYIYNSYPLLTRYEYFETENMINSWKLHVDLIKKKYSANLLWMINSLHMLKEKGKVVALVPIGVFFNMPDKELRKYLVQKNKIETIIFLPEGILRPYAGVSSALVVLSNDKEMKEIKMIDARNIYSRSRKYFYFNDEQIADIINSYDNKEPSENILNVSIKQVEENDFILSIDRYQVYENNLQFPSKLSEVVKSIFRGAQMNSKKLDEIAIVEDEEIESDYRIINISDICVEGFVNEKLKAIKITDFNKYEKFCVQDGDIIITGKHTTLKTAIYRQSEQYKDIITGNLIAIRPDREKIDPYYLKAFLDSEQGQRAMMAIATGTSILSINPKNLENAEISVPPLRIQKNIAEKYKMNMEKIERCLKEYEAAMECAKKIYITNMSNE